MSFTLLTTIGDKDHSADHIRSQKQAEKHEKMKLIKLEQYLLNRNR